MEKPYLSVVATARNDDHGLNLRRRMQIFVNGLGAQADRFAVPIELILVEWNPPPEKAPLAEALSWPETKWLQSRIVRVPPGLHGQYKHAEGLPLYQMIAKNVGIRRSRGEFVLATNIDLLFSDELFEFFANRRLETGRMYRVDRWDVDENVPLRTSIKKQLEYCATHLLRINGRGETYPVTSTGERIVDPRDVTVAAEVEIVEAVEVVEQVEGALVEDAALEEPGAEEQRPPASADVEEGREAREPTGAGRRNSPRNDSVSLLGGFYQLETGAGEPFRWASSRVAVEVTTKGPGREVFLDLDPTAELGPVELIIRVDEWETTATIETRSIARIRADFRVDVGVPVEVEVTNRDQRTPLAVDPRDLGFRVYSLRCEEARSTDSETESGMSVQVLPQRRPGFIERIRRYWNLWRSGAPGMRLTFPLPKALISGLRPRFEERGLSIAITRSRDDEIESARTYADEDGDSGSRPRETEASIDDAAATVTEEKTASPGVEATELAPEVDSDEEETEPATTEVLEADEAARPEEASKSEDKRQTFAGADYLHTNACGDFTLMSLEDWLDLRGYPEWDMYSMNIDSALCISAARAGIDEVFLSARVYHIEHSAGSGYTPEGQQKLWDRLREKGIDWIEFQEIYDWDRQLRRLGSTMIFNRRDWGLIRHDLPDEIVGGRDVDFDTAIASE